MPQSIKKLSILVVVPGPVNVFEHVTAPVTANVLATFSTPVLVVRRVVFPVATTRPFRATNSLLAKFPIPC